MQTHVDYTERVVKPFGTTRLKTGIKFCFACPPVKSPPEGARYLEERRDGERRDAPVHVRDEVLQVQVTRSHGRRVLHRHLHHKTRLFMS